jgi:hypothetical protein
LVSVEIYQLLIYQRFRPWKFPHSALVIISKNKRN